MQRTMNGANSACCCHSCDWLSLTDISLSACAADGPRCTLATDGAGSGAVGVRRSKFQVVFDQEPMAVVTWPYVL